MAATITTATITKQEKELQSRTKAAQRLFKNLEDKYIQKCGAHTEKIGGTEHQVFTDVTGGLGFALTSPLDGLLGTEKAAMRISNILSDIDNDFVYKKGLMLNMPEIKNEIKKTKELFKYMDNPTVRYEIDGYEYNATLIMSAVKILGGQVRVSQVRIARQYWEILVFESENGKAIIMPLR